MFMGIRTRRETDFEQFLRQVAKLKPLQFYSFCTFMGIRLARQPASENTKATPRAFDEVFEEMMNKFEKLDKKKRKKVLDLLKREAEKNNGATAEHCATS